MLYKAIQSFDLFCFDCTDHFVLTSSESSHILDSFSIHSRSILDPSELTVTPRTASEEPESGKKGEEKRFFNKKFLDYQIYI
jgi:hypothetical protein